MTRKKLVIVSGASRGIGKTFFDEYKKHKGTTVIGLSRGDSAKTRLDLTDTTTTYSFVKQLDLKDIDRVIYMHAIGIDKFEPHGKPHIDFDGDGIDDEVMSSNYLTFLHLAEPLIDKIKSQKIPLTMCNIGSISDIFEVPYWQSFSKTKNKVRKWCKSISDESIGSIFLNVSSTLDEEKRTYGRKGIDTTYWQTTDELLEKSFDTLDTFYESSSKYAEFDYYKFNPSFRPDYFTNLPELHAQWQRDLGYAGEKIPLGIRI